MEYSGLNRTYGIVGAGLVGSSLAEYLDAQNKLKFIVSRSDESTHRLIQTGITENVIRRSIEEICQFPDVLIIAVNDNSIKLVAEEIAEIFGNISFNRYVFHLSGTKTLSELSPFSEYPCKIFTAHPFQTFYDYAPSILENLIWGVEKGKNTEEEIKDIIAELGGKCLFLNESNVAQKELYHLVAVSASNFLVSSIEFSKIFYEHAHLKNPQIVDKIIESSVHNSLKNFQTKNVPITGPLSRADTETIVNHLNALSKYPDLKEIYSHFSLATAKILLKRNKISEVQFMNISQIFEQNS